MKIEQIHVRGRFDAQRLDVTYRVLVISITDPGSDPAKFNIFPVMDEQDVLRLQFHDVDPSWYEDGDLLYGYRLMHSFDAAQIMPFLSARLRDGVTRLLIHCEAGLSRSPSTAMAICDYLGLDRCIMDWEYAEEWDSPPNRHVYSTCCAAFVVKERGDDVPEEASDAE
jgi:predicted protein tyrosine phosphatase